MENSELLEKFLPGYRIVCRIFARYLGIDLTKIMTVLFVIFALSKSIQYAWTTVFSCFAAWLTSSVTIPAKESVHEKVLLWVSKNVINSNATFSSGARFLTVAMTRTSDGAHAGTNSTENSDGLYRECF